MPQKRHYLTAVVRRMINDVQHHVGERVLPMLTLKILIRKSDVQAIVRKRGDEVLLIAFDVTPALFNRVHIGKLVLSEDPFGRFTAPALQPNPLGP